MSKLEWALVAASSLVGLGTVLVWAGQRGHRDRWLVVLAAGIMTAVALVINVIAVQRGWWGGNLYVLSLPVLVSILLVWPFVTFTAFILGYRWLSGHTRHPFLFYLLVLSAIEIPSTLVGDMYSLSTGLLAFGAGYRVAHDIVLGLAGLSLPIVVYIAVRRVAARVCRWSRPVIETARPHS